jgi:hypothetical protein
MFLGECLSWWRNLEWYTERWDQLGSLDIDETAKLKGFEVGPNRNGVMCWLYIDREPVFIVYEGRHCTILAMGGRFEAREVVSASKVDWARNGTIESTRYVLTGCAQTLCRVHAGIRAKDSPHGLHKLPLLQKPALFNKSVQ